MILELVLTVVTQAPCAPGLVHQMPYCVEPAREVMVAEPLVVERFTSEGGVERWRPWVEVYFAPADVPRAMRILACESRGDPWARNSRSGASGLFQHMPGYWAERSARFGWAGWSIWSPDANVAIAAALVYHDPMSWRHWSCG